MPSNSALTYRNRRNIREQMDCRASVPNTHGGGVKAFVKRVLRKVPLRPLLVVEKTCWGLRFNEWFRKKNCKDAPYFEERFDLYSYLNTSFLEGAAIDYLEFGVADGDSIREWTRLNTHPRSRFVGFDTFQGLPEVWNHVGRSTPRGTFDTNGHPPTFENEPRVSFVKGLFQDTLPRFVQEFQPRNRLVLHMDADLYSSTLYALASLNQVFAPGTIVLFDEFDSFDNEFRALSDFVTAFRRDYSVLAWGGNCCAKVAIQFQESSSPVTK